MNVIRVANTAESALMVRRHSFVIETDWLYSDLLRDFRDVADLSGKIARKRDTRATYNKESGQRLKQ